MITYKYRFGFDQFFSLLVSFGLLGFSIFLLLRFTVDNVLIAVVSFLTVIGLTPIFLTANYLIKSLNLIIRIDHDLGIIEITKNRKTKTYNIGDVVAISIQKQRDIGLYGFGFNFAKYTFANGRYFISTSLMTNDYYVPSGLEPKIETTVLPIIWNAANI